MGIGRTATMAAVLVATALVGLEARVRDGDRLTIREEITVQAVFPAFEREYLLTFRAPVALPGVSLASGTYLFRRATPGVIQVLSANRRTTYAMVLTIPAVRQAATSDHVFVFTAVPRSDAPHRLAAWFLPGSTIGQQIVYPTSQVNASSSN